MSPFTKAVTLGAFSVFVLAAAGCGRREEPAPQPQFRPTATVKDIMTSIVDPEADVLWNSVATIVSLTGTEEREPRTDEEWAAVRRSAIQLVEATNLLRIPGRLVARHGEKSENPRIELAARNHSEDDCRGSRDLDQARRSAARCGRAGTECHRRKKRQRSVRRRRAHGARLRSVPPAVLVSAERSGGVEDRSLEDDIDDAPVAAAVAVSKGGAIKGHVRVKGKVPGNPVIRMGMDPMCAKLNAGKRPVQEIVAATADGSLANVFVSLQGSFPASPVPAEPVTIDQRACMYVPRVVGARVGQTLQVRNSDEVLHNVHGTFDARQRLQLQPAQGRHRAGASLEGSGDDAAGHVRRAQVDDRVCRGRRIIRISQRAAAAAPSQLPTCPPAPTPFRPGTSCSGW